MNKIENLVIQLTVKNPDLRPVLTHAANGFADLLSSHSVILGAAALSQTPSIAYAAQATQDRIVAQQREWLDRANAQWFADHPILNSVTFQSLDRHMRRWYTGPRSIMRRKIRRAFL